MRLIVFIHHDTQDNGPDGESAAMSKDVGETIPHYLLAPGARIADYPKVGGIRIKAIENYGTLETPHIVVFSEDIVFTEVNKYDACIGFLKENGYTTGGELGNGKGRVLPVSPSMRRFIARHTH